MNTEDLLTAFARAGTVAEGELDMALLVAHVIDPQTDSVAVTEGVSRLAEGLPAPATPDTLLNTMVDAGFGGPPGSQVVTASFSHLGWVLDHRQGIPISLAVLIIATARQAGLEATGINYPGHFLVRLQGAFVDPLRMTVIDDNTLSAGEGELATADARAIGLRMLNNLKALAVSERNFTRVLELIDYQFAVADGVSAYLPSLHFEKAEYWRQLGAFAAAREAYLQCAATSPDGELKVRAQQRAKDLEGRDETLH